MNIYFFIKKNLNQMQKWLLTYCIKPHTQKWHMLKQMNIKKKTISVLNSENKNMDILTYINYTNIHLMFDGSRNGIFLKNNNGNVFTQMRIKWK